VGAVFHSFVVRSGLVFKCKLCHSFIPHAGARNERWSFGFNAKFSVNIKIHSVSVADIHVL